MSDTFLTKGPQKKPNTDLRSNGSHQSLGLAAQVMRKDSPSDDHFSDDESDKSRGEVEERFSNLS